MGYEKEKGLFQYVLCIKLRTRLHGRPRNERVIPAFKKHVVGTERWLTPIIPAFWEVEVDESPEVSSLRPAWPTWWNPISTKNTKISWLWWCMPVIPATWETVAQESLQPGRQRLQGAWIVPLHSSLGHRLRFRFKNRKQNETKNPLC